MSKEVHAFSPDIAAQIGVNAAIILQHLVTLHKFNLDKTEHWDGSRYWIKKTAKAFTKTYPYFTAKEIRGALDKMEKMGLIVGLAGLADNRWDRAKSYSLENEGFDLMGIEEEERHFPPFYKRANASVLKGKSEVTQRANQKLPKGQINKDYTNSISSTLNILSGSPDVPSENENSPLEEKEKTSPPIPPSPSPVPAELYKGDPLPGLHKKRNALVSEYLSKPDGTEKEKIKRQGVTVKVEIELNTQINQAIEYLNEKTGFAYKLSTKPSRNVLARRLQTDSLEDIFTVIDSKAKAWRHDPNMRQYLRPETLFNGHFEAYLQTAILDKKKPARPSVFDGIPVYGGGSKGLNGFGGNPEAYKEKQKF